MLPRVRHGFVLLEAVVALLIIGLASAAALDLFATHLRAAARQPALLTAAALAQDRMTALRFLSAEELRRLPDSLARGEFPAPFAGYRWRAAATRSREESFYDLRVDVEWSAGRYTLASLTSVPLAQRVTR
jgi:prepilin-type N-terminal cleavage/methylation domain-containing protein